MTSYLLKALNEIDDKYIEESYMCIKFNKRNSAPKFRYMMGIAAAIMLIIILNINFPTLARKLPIVGGVFEYLQSKLDFSGSYDKYSENVNIIIADNGISVTLQEVYCDGEALFVAYQIESEKAFSEYTSKNFLKTQLDFDGKMYVTSDNQSFEIDDFGVRGLEGEFVDDYTFVGVDTIRLIDHPFPKNFDFTININKWKLILNSGEKSISGSWNMTIPVQVNENDIEIIDVNLTENAHSIDKVVISPVMITIYTSYPELYNGTVDYDVVVFSDKSEEHINFQGRYGESEGKTWIPRNRVGEKLDIYVVDSSTFELNGIDAYSKSEIEAHAIVSTHINLATKQ